MKKTLKSNIIPDFLLFSHVVNVGWANPCPPLINRQSVVLILRKTTKPKKLGQATSVLLCSKLFLIKQQVINLSPVASRILKY